MSLTRRKITYFDMIRHSIDVKLGMRDMTPEAILNTKWHKGFFDHLYNTHITCCRNIKAPYWLEFTAMMKNRLIVGEFRYGDRCMSELQGLGYDCVGYAKKRMNQAHYNPHEDLEGYIDAANLFYLHWLARGDMSYNIIIADCYRYYEHSRKKGLVVHTRHDLDDSKRPELYKRTTNET